MPGKLKKLIKPKPPAFTPENDQSLKRRLSFLSKVSTHQGTTTPASLAGGSTVGVPRISPSPPNSHPTQGVGERLTPPLPHTQARGRQDAPSVLSSRNVVRSQVFVTDPNQSGARKRTPPTTGPSPAMMRHISASMENIPSTERMVYRDSKSAERPMPSGVENQVPRSEVSWTERLRRLSRPTKPPVIRTASREREPPPQPPLVGRRSSNPSFPVPPAQVPQVSRSDVGHAPPTTVPSTGRSPYPIERQPQYPSQQQYVASRRVSNPSLPVAQARVPQVSRSDVGHAPPPMTTHPNERPYRHSDSIGRPIYISSSQPGIPPNSTLNKSGSNIPPPQYTKNPRDSGISGVGSWSRGSDISSRVSSSFPSRHSRTSSQVLAPDRSQNSSQLGLPNEPGTRGSHISFPSDTSRPRRSSHSNFVGGFAAFRPQANGSQVNLQPTPRSNEDERYPRPEPRKSVHTRTSSLPSSVAPPPIGNPPVGTRTEHGHGHRRTRNQSTHARQTSSPSHSRQGSMFPFHDNRKPVYPYANWHLLPSDQRPVWLVKETGHHGKVGAAEVQVPA